MSGKHTMTKSDSERIQSTQAQKGGDMSSKGFAAHAQSAGDANSGSTEATNTGSSTGSSGSSGGGGGSASGGASRK